MKKLILILLSLLMMIAVIGCSQATTQTSSVLLDDANPPVTEAEIASQAAPDAKSDTIYVLGPTPDHGWTAQAGTYAEEKVSEINSQGKWQAVYMSASGGEEQVGQVETILSNGDAAGVVFFALDDSAKAGQEALIAADAPFVSFDRIIAGPDKHAILNTSAGDNWQTGAAVAYWLDQRGMKPGAALITLIGDNGTVCSRRQEGFEQYLRGEIDYFDKHTDQTYQVSAPWTEEQIDALCADYKHVCNWSADGAYEYLAQKLPEVVTKAKENEGSLYIFSMDDEMTFGMLNLLESDALDSAIKADLENINVYISAIGGMAELYAVLDGTSPQSHTAKTYFDDLMSVHYSPKMMENAIDYMLNYLDGNWSYQTGDSKYEDVWIVDAENVSLYEGFAGH